MDNLQPRIWYRLPREPTFISRGQWGPRAPHTPSRTPPGVGPYIQPQPLPLAGAGHSSFLSRPFVGAGRELHSHARAGPTLELTPHHI